MEYKCIKEMWLEKYGEECFPSGEDDCVPIGSTWLQDDESNLIGGEVHLDCLKGSDELGWIEITESDLKQYFEPVN